MSKYTTGEIAKLCGITVRTVQYYDTRNLLVPSELSDGGRRLYSEDDLKRMKIICFLRELDLPINTIAQLLGEKHPENVIGLLLEQQTLVFQEEISERQNKLEKLETLKRELKAVEHFSIESIGDIAHIMENKKKLDRVRGIVLGVGVLLEIIEAVSLIFAIQTGFWWPFILGLCVAIGGGLWICGYYFKNMQYICPQCHTTFRPGFKEAFWANHTPNTRKLTCTACGHKGFCVETYGGK